MAKVPYEFDKAYTGDLQLGNALVTALLAVFKEPEQNPIRFGEDHSFTAEFSSNKGKAVIVALKHAKETWLYQISGSLHTKKDKEKLETVLTNISPT